MKRIEQNIRATTNVFQRPKVPNAQDRLDTPLYWCFTVDGKEKYVSNNERQCRAYQGMYIDNALHAMKQAARMLRDFGFIVVPPGRQGKNKK